jgi:hypothetical protein
MWVAKVASWRILYLFPMLTSSDFYRGELNANALKNVYRLLPIIPGNSINMIQWYTLMLQQNIP